MLEYITKENICKKVLEAKGVPVTRFSSNEGMIKKISGYYFEQCNDFNIAKKVENFIRDTSEMPIELCIIKHLGNYDAGVVEVIQLMFPVSEVVNLITDTIMQEKNILMLGRMYSKLLDSSIRNMIGDKCYKQIMHNIDDAIEGIIAFVASESSTLNKNKDEVMFSYLTEKLHFDFYLDFIEATPNSYKFIKRVVGEELALKAFRGMLILKKRTIKNNDWSWRLLYRVHKGVVDKVMEWMGDSQNKLTKEDKELKKLFFDWMLK